MSAERIAAAIRKMREMVVRGEFLDISQYDLMELDDAGLVDWPDISASWSWPRFCDFGLLVQGNARPFDRPRAEHQHHLIDTADRDSIIVCDFEDVPALCRMALDRGRDDLVIVGRDWLQFGEPVAVAAKVRVYLAHCARWSVEERSLVHRINTKTGRWP